MSGAAQTPILSLVLCSRNDEYMGNSRWRLEAALNDIGAQVARLNGEAAIEVIVTDWGSEVPLRQALTLDPAAVRIVSFITVPPEVARRSQRDSPFAEVIALNVAARRARGQYIGRIDQDTLVGRNFLKQFLAWVETGGPRNALPLATATWYACRRSLPYRFAVRCPSSDHLARFVRWFGRWLKVETGTPYFHGGVGIWLMHRDLWGAAGGYDERMIYMNDMEIDMAARLTATYPMVDLGRLVAYDFYHLDHYHPRGPRASSAHRRVNASNREPLGLRPSGESWGLSGVALDISPVARCKAIGRAPAVRALPAFAALLAWTMAQTLGDWVWYKTLPVLRQRWTRRAGLVWQVVSGQPVIEWPGRLRKLWVERPSAKAGS